MNHTDENLKIVLAKMLPEKIVYKPIGCRWNNGKEVLDTELLHLCWVVEEELTWKLKTEYRRELQRICITLTDSHCATWKQRVEALAKVKGIEI